MKFLRRLRPQQAFFLTALTVTSAIFEAFTTDCLTSVSTFHHTFANSWAFLLSTAAILSAKEARKSDQFMRCQKYSLCIWKLELMIVEMECQSIEGILSPLTKGTENFGFEIFQPTSTNWIFLWLFRNIKLWRTWLTKLGLAVISNCILCSLIADIIYFFMTPRSFKLLNSFMAPVLFYLFFWNTKEMFWADHSPQYV